MFRFTIRDVVWLTVVVTLGCAWWLNRGGLAIEVFDLSREVAMLRAETVVVPAGGLVDEETIRSAAVIAEPNAKPCEIERSSGPPKP